MTLREIKDRVLLNLGEVGNAELEPAIKQEANKALNHIALALDLPDLRRVSTVVLSPGDYQLDLTSLGRVRQVVAVVRKRALHTEYLRYLPAQSLRELYGDPANWPEGSPACWTVEGTTLLLHPRPSKTEELLVAWLSWPQPLVEDSDSVDDRIAGIVVEYCTAMMHLSLENLDAHRFWMKQAVEELENLKASLKSPKALHNLEVSSVEAPPYYLDPFCKGVR